MNGEDNLQDLLNDLKADLQKARKSATAAAKGKEDRLRRILCRFISYCGNYYTRCLYPGMISSVPDRRVFVRSWNRSCGGIQ